MTEHLSQQTIEDVLQRRLNANELLTVDDHLADCPACAAALADAAHVDDALEIDAASPHLSFETLEAHANERLDDVETEIADFHLLDCHSCANDLKDLVVLRRELTSTESSEAKASSFSIFRPSFLVPAFGVLLAGAIGVWWLLSDRPVDVNDVATGSNVTPVIPAEPGANTENINTGAVNSNEQPQAIARIRDGGSTIELFADGRVAGLNSPAFEDRVRNALSKQQIDIPSDIRDLAGQQGVLMSGSSQGGPFALVSPVGKVVESGRPTFSWKPLSGADAYRVEVFDANFNRVAGSPEMTRTTWQPEKALPRGKVYAWQVTALKDGVESKSPVRPAPNAKFKVLDAAKSETIGSARRSGSRLALGLAYAEAGMLADAERELAALARANPNNEAIRRLLQKVRATR